MGTRVHPLWSNEELFPEKNVGLYLWPLSYQTLTLAVKVEKKIFVGVDGELNV